MSNLSFRCRLVVAWAAAGLLDGAAAASPVTCHWTSKQQCDAGAPCRLIPPVVWTIIDQQTKRYQRCDRRGCDSYDAVVTVGPGAFTVYDLVGRGLFLKVDTAGAATEVASLGTSILISNGSCR